MSDQYEETETLKRRISEREQGDVKAINLNEYAATLPAELEGQWIVTVVRSYGKARGITTDAGLQDLFQEALGAALRAVGEAEAKGADLKGFLKIAVQSHLKNVQKYEDYRDARLENTTDVIMAARKPMSDFRTALKLLSPAALTIWRAYKKANGRINALARNLNTSDYLAETKYLPRLVNEMREALAYVKTIRRGF